MVSTRLPFVLIATLALSFSTGRAAGAAGNSPGPIGQGIATDSVVTRTGGYNDAGFDSSCDLPDVAGDEVLLDTTPWSAGAPSIAWNGSGYGVAYWNAMDFTVFRLITADGQLLGDPVVVDLVDGEKPDVVWTGSGYGVAQAPGHGEVYLSVLDESGAITTHAVLLAQRDARMRVELVWTGNEFAVAYNDDDDGEIYFVRTDASATVIGDEVRVTESAGSSERVSLVWTGTEYGLAWQDDRDGNREIYFCRLDASGTKIGDDVRVTSHAARSEAPSLVWAGTEYGLAWEDDRSGERELYFTRISSGGVKIGGDVQVTASTSLDPALTWTGAEYGLVWEHQSESVGRIRFARLDATGSMIGGSLPVSESHDPSDATVVWNGAEYAAVWQNTVKDALFRRIACDCVDDDGDGVTVCNDCDDDNIHCTTDCTDLDVDGYCVTHDCDDGVADCTTDCTDADTDGLAVCAGDCDDANPNCTTDCTDLDVDGYCITHDCNDAVADCTTDCTDGDEDGLAVCAGDCDDANPNCTTDCTDLDVDGYCVTHDCDDGVAECTTDCTDGDEDGLAVCAGDCDDGEAGCTTDCTDADMDGIAACAGDCDEDRSDVYPGAPQLCDGTNNDCDDPDWPEVPVEEIDDDGDGYEPCAGDCDDTDPAVSPLAVESCNGVDDDCNGLTDEDQNGEDSDDDTVHNLCDNCPFVSNVGQDDHDDDTVGDDCDNCPFDANSAQSDQDGDQIGDRCDLDDGLIHLWFDEPGELMWDEESGYDAWNCYCGDLEVLSISRLYTQAPGSNDLADRICGLGTPGWTHPDPIETGAAAFYLVTGVTDGVEGGLDTDSSGAERPNDSPCP